MYLNFFKFDLTFLQQIVIFPIKHQAEAFVAQFAARDPATGELMKKADGSPLTDVSIHPAGSHFCSI